MVNTRSSGRPSTPDQQRSGGFRLWFGVLGGHVAWSAQLMAAYALVDEYCPNPSAWELFLVYAVTAAALALAAASARAAWSLYRRGAGTEPVSLAASRTRFPGLLGLFLNGIYLFAILLQGIYIPFVAACL